MRPVSRPTRTTADALRRSAAWACYAVALAFVGLGIVLTVQDGRSVFAGDVPTSWAVSVGTGLLGAFVVTRRPGSWVGWLFVATSLMRGITGAAIPWSIRVYETAPGSLPFGHFAAWLQAWTVAAVVPVAPLILALFPDDRPVGRWSRQIIGLASVSLVLVGIVVPVVAWPLPGIELAPATPTPDTMYAQVGVGIMAAGVGLGVLGVLLGVASLIDRARREHGDVRRQILWFAYGAAVTLVVNAFANLSGLIQLRPLGVVALLVGVGLGIFRYRLYDLDQLINRTLVYGLVTVAAVACYGALAVVVGAVLGGRSVAVAAIAAFVVALVLRPLRDRSQDLIDRVFARRTHSGVAIMRSLGRRVGHENVDPATVVEALQRALRDPCLEAYFPLRDSGVLVDVDGLPTDPGLPSANIVTEVRPHGELVAVLVHAPVDPGLLASVTRAATVVLEHARLQAELLVRLAEVRASRSRLVAAADAERRRIERDLHDGAQQRLVGLAVHIQSARRHAEIKPALDELLTFTVGQLHAAVGDIRALVYGILPPALATSGLGSALSDLASTGEVDVENNLHERFDPIGEATAWFVACEGVANARKHAPEARVLVQVADATGTVTLSVSDQGPGGAVANGDGLRNLRDRVEACGGTFTVASGPEMGTVLTAVLPKQRQR
jgi:signal transduction histidine kinase